jgi:hypothetical protein
MPPSTDHYSKNDVFFARGHGVEKLPGNIHYRHLIRVNSKAYTMCANHRITQTAIANKVITSILLNGGVFYFHDKSSSKEGSWSRMSSERAILKKVKQSLRDCRSNSLDRKAPPSLFVEGQQIDKRDTNAVVPIPYHNKNIMIQKTPLNPPSLQQEIKNACNDDIVHDEIMSDLLMSNKGSLCSRVTNQPDESKAMLSYLEDQFAHSLDLEDVIALCSDENDTAASSSSSSSSSSSNSTSSSSSSSAITTRDEDDRSISNNSIMNESFYSIDDDAFNLSINMNMSMDTMTGEISSFFDSINSNFEDINRVDGV